MTLCAYPDDCRAPATVEEFCEHHWWIDQAETATELMLAREARLNESPWKTLARERWDEDYGDGDYDRRLAEALTERDERVDAPSSRSVSVPLVDHDPGDCDCEDCR